MKKVFALLGLLTLLLLAGCVGIYSQYLLTMEYTNPHSNKTEYIDIPVSQYEYERTDVGTSYTVTIHPIILELKVPITRNTNTTKVSMANTLVPMLMVMPLGYLLFTIYNISRKKAHYLSLIFPFIMIGIALLLISTQQPEFTATGVIIDKTFEISGGA